MFDPIDFDTFAERVRSGYYDESKEELLYDVKNDLLENEYGRGKAEGVEEAKKIIDEAAKAMQALFDQHHMII